MSVRKAPVVFKEGFRSRSYCLTECTVRTTSYELSVRMNGPVDR